MFKKSLALILTVIIIFSSADVFAYTPEIISNSYTMYRPTQKKISQIHSVGSEDKKVAENEFLILYLNESDLSIKVVEKATGYIYSSNDIDLEGLNGFWRNYVNSPVTIKYIDSSFKTIQESIFDDSKSEKKVSISDDGFTADLYFAKGKIRLSYGVRLEGDSIVMYLDDDSIVEEANTAIISQRSVDDTPEKLEEEMTAREKLMARKTVDTSSYDLYTVTMYPFFGALEAGQQDGYTLIPDGSGALIRYDKKYKGVNIPFEKMFHAYDYGIPYNSGSENYNTYYYSELYFRLYGMVHGINQSGFINLIEDGGEYGRLVSYPAGVTTDFYFTTIEYYYNSIYQQKISSNQNITSKLEKRNTVNIKERYKFVNKEEANYVGMANVYKNYLLEKGELNTYKIDKTPLTINATMEVMKKGIIGNYMEVVTTTDDIVEMEKYLTQNGVEKIFFSIFADKEQLTGKTSDANKLDKKVQGSYSFSEMNEYLRQNKHLSFLGTDIGIFLGNGQIETDVIRMANKEYAQNKLKLGNQNYSFSFLTSEGQNKNIKSVIEKISENGFDGLKNFNNITPSTNFGKNNYETRKQSMQNLISIGEMVKDNGIVNGSEWLYDYGLKSSNISFNTIMETTIYQFISDTIPFYQIVLSGNIPMVSGGLNSSSDLDRSILHCIEFNVYPQFDVLASDYDKLDGAIYNNTAVFTVEFEKWKQKIVNAHQEIASKLDEVLNESIVKHEMVAPRIAAVTYSNGKTIVVNYTDHDFSYKNTIVKRKDSVVIWQSQQN